MEEFQDSIVFIGRDYLGEGLALYEYCPIFYIKEKMYSYHSDYDFANYTKLDSTIFPQIAPGELWLLDTADLLIFYCVEKH